MLRAVVSHGSPLQGPVLYIHISEDQNDSLSSNAVKVEIGSLPSQCLAVGLAVMTLNVSIIDVMLNEILVFRKPQILQGSLWSRF